MINIIPALITDDVQRLKKFIGEAEGKVKRIQIDIVDGEFADNETVRPGVMEYIDTSLDLDFHLMVSRPATWVEECVRAEADRVIGQVEMMESQIGFVEKVQKSGLGAGLALDLETSLLELDPAAMARADVVLLMAVSAGFGGQKFNRKVVEKVTKLCGTRTSESMGFRICVDGGVREENVGDLVLAGADEVSVGERIFEGNLERNIEKLKKASYVKKK